QWYNGEHRHSAIRYVTPNERHRGEDENILKRRKVVYAAAKQRHPARWSGKTRNWNRVEEVCLNPPKEHQTAKGQNSRAA
ncbi:MAG: IS3 family transposase, partial [Gammaproteobacteria bacterium]